MILTREGSGDRWRVRPDGAAKVDGSLAYLTDMSRPDALWARVLRSEHAHARIRSISIERAEALPGVHAVITHRDVPGLNRFGIAFPHQPALCSDRVRYVGDAVAAVAAETPEIAAQALTRIDVEYEPLPPLTDPRLALLPDAPQLHEDGNLLHRTEYRTGEPEELEALFARCAHIVEREYATPRQMHAYMETEGGLFIPEADGRLTVYSATQHGLMDRMQLARMLDWEEERIRVVSSPIGGSFGGKDELNVQPYGSLLALKTGRPVRLHNSRAESVRAGLKRHPMLISMRTGTDRDGRLLAHRVRILSDTGAYATLGAEVLNFSTEHVIGPYRWGQLDVEGHAVYTNNGVSGEFRGFGGNQAIFALESQLDELAELHGIDPWEFRRMNMREPSDPGPLGQPIAPTDGARQVWEALERSPLWQSRPAVRLIAAAAGIEGGSGTRAGSATGAAEEARLAAAEPDRYLSRQDAALAVAEASRVRAPWVRVGYGAALTMHGAGLGYGIPDPAGGILRLAADGVIEAVFGYEEFGQGLLATLSGMLIEQFGFAPDDIRILIGDTDIVPNSGSSTASRATSMMWMALRRLRPELTRRLTEAASAAAGSGVPAERLRTGAGGVVDEDGSIVATYAELARRSAAEPIACETTFHYPVTSKPHVGAHFLYTYAAVAARVEVDLRSGRVKVTDQHHAVAAGPVANPQGYLGQIEGGASMALGFTLSEDAVMEEGRYATRNFDTYLVPSAADVGRLTVEAIEELPEDDSYGPRGVGEIGSVALAPAITAAIRDAVGVRVRRLPVEPGELLRPWSAGWQAKGGGSDA
ncbi:molybdopterin-dependent oxidoreductase [Paenibacillus albicereus]|uniref:Molybdopterin-dependent oxidoreductase n=1 Tax=Paenibacillus albicereus TaxID=2726185 RepID=A0A6H2H168_9BACL|nr:molybdopterin cofactor-binding domain-containing protein [Paenibacillus albicereus]QJC53433.1 molybdopterin-dependent oxidoreductase [Paenibacillus albicereus]